MAKPPATQQLLDARGRVIMNRRGTRPTTIADDAYHLLRTASWPRVLLLFAAVFLGSNLVFATVLWLGHARITNVTGFPDDFWFSVQSMGTIGYGYLAPADTLSNTVVTIETFYSIILTALVTGIFFARFATPRSRVLFSKVALIADFDGQRVLQFRMANERTTAIVEATVHAYITRDEKLAHGEAMRRVYDLELRRSTSPVFALSFLVVHPIDAKSPLFDITPEALRAANTNLVVTVTGIDDQLATNIHARYVWSVDDILFDRRYAELFKLDEAGKRYLDLGPMHDTVPL
ncbi:MAG: ATP-sensitive inward rectifier potassium channel 10 [Kofleriaceae bacterium]